MLRPTPVTPAVVFDTAAESLAPLHERLWAAVEDDDLIEGVAAVERLAASMAAARVRMLAELEARQVARRQLAWTSTHEWYAHLAGTTIGAARKTVKHAVAMTTDRAKTLAALEAGEVSLDQAGLVCDTVADLPHSGDLRARGEQTLLDDAGRLNATELRRAARHLAHVVDPDRTDRREEAALERDERAAHLDRTLSIVEDGAGGVRLKGRGSVEDGAILRAALLPLTRPEPTETDDENDGGLEPDPRDHGARLWDALVTTAQHSLDTDLPPESHGALPRVHVLIDLDQLRAGLSSAGKPVVTEDGLTLSAAAVRRLACDADLVPTCLDSTGRVLDVGRTHRLVTYALWLALIARDRHCTFPSCRRPPIMCHAHHIQHWADGGGTDLDNLVLLCGLHHRVIHHTPWQVRLNPDDGRAKFLPPPRGTLQRAWTRHRPRRE
jgi:hypothetical protein